MRSIDWYIDTARQQAGLASDNKLAQHIGMTSGGISAFRQRRAWPSDATMCKLAALARVPADEALLELNAWRAQDEASRRVYAALLSRLTGHAAAILIAVATLFTFPGSGNATQTLGEQINVRSLESRHYATFMRRAL